MKTLDYVIAAYKNGREFQCIDGRDIKRLLPFIPSDNWKAFGYDYTGDDSREPLPFIEDEILVQLCLDVAFGFEKALGCRGISADCQYGVVKTLLWVLDDPMQYHPHYAQYGLPLFKAVALKYGFDNPIGDDTGSESKYEEH